MDFKDIQIPHTHKDGNGAEVPLPDESEKANPNAVFDAIQKNLKEAEKDISDPEEKEFLKEEENEIAEEEKQEIKTSTPPTAETLEEKRKALEAGML